MFALSPLPRTVQAALRDFGSSKLSTRISALRDLVRHAGKGELEASRAVRDALADRAEEIRAEAALGLADAEIREGAESLATVARRDESLRVRQMALLALGELGESSTTILKALVEARKEGDAEERFQALLSLHQLRATGVKEAILESMLDPDPEVRRLAFRIARAEWAELSDFPAIGRTRARAALEDPHVSVSIAAALTLAEFGDASGSSILLDIVRRRLPERSAEDEQAAIELTGELGLTEAVPELRRRLFSRLLRDPFAYQTRIALARLGDERAKAAILRELNAWTLDDRTLAVVAAGRARLLEAREKLVALSNRPERADPEAVQDALVLLDRGAADGR